jgi:DNA recombination protein RmuC
VGDPSSLFVLLAVLGLALLLAILVGQARLRERAVRLDTRIADQALHSEASLKALAETREMLERRLGEDRERIETALSQQRETFDQRQFQALRTMLRTLQMGMGDVRKQVNEALLQNAELVGRRVDSLGEVVDRRLGEIGGQVASRLAEGFEKTNATFVDITARLALIDEAQRKISDLSSNVISLQEILADKRSRGAFGEVQLSALIRNVLPESAYSFQHTLGNGNRADCVLFLPAPTGTVVIDAKFPLESFQLMRDDARPAEARKAAEQRFKVDIRRHVQDIAKKYLIPGETSDGALMFIPAEAVFAEIHAHHPQLVELAFRSRVWFASPSTLMAILTTARAVLKDEATREQVHLIRQHLDRLADDFKRFQGRMDNLSRHIGLAHQDTQEIQASAKKISRHFQRIENAELDNPAGVGRGES